MVLLGAAICACSEGDRTLFVVNDTGAPGLTVKVDGKPVATSLPLASGLATAGGMQQVSLKPGRHTLTALDARGQVIEQQDIHANKKSYGFVFAPGHRPDVCFQVRTQGYGNYQGSTAPVDLHAQSTIWEMEHFIDQWFEQSPDSVTVAKGQTGSHERAVVMLRCPSQPKN